MSDRPTITRIAQAYQIGREHAHRIMRQNDLKPGDLLDPDLVFQKLMAARVSPLRTRLSYPAVRAEIRKQLTI